MSATAAAMGEGACSEDGLAGRVRRWASGIPGVVALCIFVFAASWWGIASHHSGRIACIWLASPVVLSVLLRSPTHRWPRWIGALVVGNFAADLAAGDDVWLAAGLTASNLSEVLLAAGVLARVFGTGIDLTRTRDLRWFVLGAALLGPAAAGIPAALILQGRGEHFVSAWLTWFSADALGILTVTPLISICTPLRLRDVPSAARREIAAWMLVLAAVLALTFSQNAYPLLFLPVAILVHMGLRMGPLGAVIGIGEIAVAAYVMTFNGYGPIAEIDPGHESQLLVLEAFLAGSVLAVLPVVAVLADRSRLERRLQEAETLFRGVFESSPEMLFVHRRGPDGRPVIEACNQAAAEHLRLSRAGLEGRHLGTIRGAETVLPVAEAVEAVFAGAGPIRQQIVVPDAERPLVLEKMHVPLDDPASGEVVRVVASIRDVTHIAEAESALRASEARRRLLSDNTTDLIVELDLEANRTYVSRSCRELLGYDPEELLGTSPLADVHSDDLHSLVRCIGELKAGNDRATSTHRLRHKEGRWIWCEANWRLVRNDAGEDVGFVASVRNVEQRKSAEKELVQARMDAERAKRDAERASAAKSEFLATVSHEIRTPLNGIAGYTGLLLKDADLTPSQARYADRIRTASAALKTVVDDILDFSKIEAGQIALDPVAFRPRKLIDDVMSIVRGSSIGRGLRLESRVTPDLPELVLGDENRLRQVLLNLMNNAVKFTPAGEVVLHVEDRGPGRTGRRIRFRVRDTGIGIAPDQQARLFQRFSQIDGTIARRYGGTGLGLAISQQLVGLMGGEIRVDSRQGHGSEFSFEIAFQPATEVEIDEAGARPHLPGCGRRTILVVEDVEVNRELALTVLRAAGHVVDAAVNGEEAIEKVASKEYDLVLMDIQMPGMDGIAATRGIRALGGSRSRLPIVAMTANVLPEQIAAIRAAGLNDHVGKPFEPQDLDRVIARWACGDGQALEVSAPAAAAAAAGTPASVFDRLVSAIGRETCMELLDSFERDLRERLVCERPDREELARDAHALKGEAGQLGFDELAAACRDLEEACLDGREVAAPMARARRARGKALERIDTLRAA